MKLPPPPQKKLYISHAIYEQDFKLKFTLQNPNKKEKCRLATVKMQSR